MTKPIVYLAGPIGGLTWEEATGWRDSITNLMPDFECRSPLRDLDGLSIKDSCFVTDGKLSNSRGDSTFSFDKLFHRDFQDTITADALLVNFIGAKRQSVGTVSEIAWAYLRNTPVFVAIDDGNLNNNVFLTPQYTGQYPTLKETVNALRLKFGFLPFDFGDGAD